MAFPTTQKFFNVFDENQEYLNQAKQFTPPKLTRKTEDYQGGGMDGTVPIDLGAEKMEAEIVYVGKLWHNDYGTQTIDGVYRRVTASYQNSLTGEVEAVEWEMRGRNNDLDDGTVERGKLNEEKEKLSLNYYKKSVNGIIQIEIDILNMVYNVRNKSGELVDILADHKAAIQ